MLDNIELLARAYHQPQECYWLLTSKSFVNGDYVKYGICELKHTPRIIELFRCARYNVTVNLRSKYSKVTVKNCRIRNGITTSYCCRYGRGETGYTIDSPIKIDLELIEKISGAEIIDYV